MQFDEFSKSIKDAQPPATLNPYALSLWFDAKEDWEKAHTIIQDIEDSNAAWIHAYLHRKEGDQSNARYWYHRAGKNVPTLTLQQEWEEIARAIL